MIKSMLKHVGMMERAMKYETFENLDFKEKQPKTSGSINFSTSNIQISHADACVRCCAGFTYHMVRSTLCDDVPWGSRRPESRSVSAKVKNYGISYFDIFNLKAQATEI